VTKSTRAISAAVSSLLLVFRFFTFQSRVFTSAIVAAVENRNSNNRLNYSYYGLPRHQYARHRCKKLFVFFLNFGYVFYVFKVYDVCTFSTFFRLSLL